jgi:hypothetical protein
MLWANLMHRHNTSFMFQQQQQRHNAQVVTTSQNNEKFGDEMEGISSLMQNPTAAARIAGGNPTIPLVHNKEQRHTTQAVTTQRKSAVESVEKAHTSLQHPPARMPGNPTDDALMRQQQLTTARIPAGNPTIPAV